MARRFVKRKRQVSWFQQVQNTFFAPRGNTQFLWHRWSKWLLLLILCLASILRLSYWDEKSLWQDEVFTYASALGNNNAVLRELGYPPPAPPGEMLPVKKYVYPSHYVAFLEAKQPIESVLGNLHKNVQGPFFPLLNRMWIELVNSVSNNLPTPWDLRLFSIVVGILSVLPAYWLGKCLSGRRFGLILAVLTAVAGAPVIWSQMSRMYGWGIFLTLTTTWLCARLFAQSYKIYSEDEPALKDAFNRQRGVYPAPWAGTTWMMWGVLTILGLYSHYLYALIALFQIGFLIQRGARFGLGFWLPLLGSISLITLGMSPWIYAFINQIGFVQQFGPSDSAAEHVTTVTNEVVFLATRMNEGVDFILHLWSELLGLLVPGWMLLKITLSGVIGLTLFAMWRSGLLIKRGVKLAAMGILIFVVCQMALYFGFQGAFPILKERYLLLLTPMMILLLGCCIEALAILLPRIPAFLTIFTIIACLLSNSWQFVSGKETLDIEQYKPAAAIIKEKGSPTDVVVMTHAGVHAVGMSYYLPKSQWFYALNKYQYTTPEQLNTLMKTLKQKHAVNYPGQRRLWLVLTHPSEFLETNLPKAIQQAGWQLKADYSFQRVAVYCFLPQ